MVDIVVIVCAGGTSSVDNAVQPQPRWVHLDAVSAAENIPGTPAISNHFHHLDF